MEYLRELFARWRKPQRPAESTPPILNRVSLDILLRILDYLPPESAVALALTCKPLKRLLGTRYFQKVRSSGKATIALLELLALPNDIACSPCKRLHSMENMLLYNGATYSAGSRIRKYDSLRLPYETLHGVAVLCDQYDCKKLVKPW
ncbi:hypothetical protein EG329_000885 [Mollisiaceae sp. DMI_Dod_QoI]|nr:hypothetical protein EG329_000885 [Helotiales sp. DMI_Dod_QoI]